ncbi:serine hydrolase domain-containing protein [Joostella sp. CR20]|uniref:serine hydrolase domain-containing protein n=1 Tax=Joostella sp. CR20 TaxID=2804312 RepID=UPI00313B8111
MTYKRSISNIVLLLVFFIFQNSLTAQNLAKVNPESVGFSSERLEFLTNTFKQYVTDEKLSGSVTLVARHGKIAYFNAEGFQDIENKIPMQENTIFRIASQTKAIVSVGIMMLQEEGKLLISDPVGKYIPEFQNTTVAVANENGGYEVVPAKRPITIHDLLTHTSGVGYGGGVAEKEWNKAGIQGWYFADRNEPILETVKQIASLPFEAQPGEQFVYGYNTDILGAIIEVVSKTSLDNFLHTKILNPLQMNDTHFYVPSAKSNRVATVYSSAENGIERAPTEGTMVSQGNYVKGPKVSFSGGAGLISTANDYVRFLQMMLNKGTLNGVRILSRKSVELMTTNNLNEAEFSWGKGTGFGLGFTVLEDLGKRGTLGSVGEYGWGGAYHSTYWVDPAEDLIVVYFTQLIPANNIDDHEKLRALIYQAIED